ncbi:MAG: DUF4143 domain-containing protein [Candidatus Moduliflexus flocculans]|nr:DUF4143 domain-containing protein [Candidatus Moduliflexus flocculans]
MDSFFRPRHPVGSFRFRDPDKFNIFFEYIMRARAAACSRYRGLPVFSALAGRQLKATLRALEMTHAITVVKPFHGGGRKELVKMPKVYALTRDL